MKISIHLAPFFENVTAFISSQNNIEQILRFCAITLVLVLCASLLLCDRYKLFNRLFVITSVLTLIIFRSISANAVYAIDEGMHIANAMALSHDFRLWVSTDTTTFGPINAILILIFFKPLKFFFPSMELTYFFLRMLNIFIILTVYILLYKTFVKRAPKKLAYIALFFYVMFFSFGFNADFLAFNAEFPYILFISLSLYFLYKFINNEDALNILLSGLFVGFMPHIKLQTLPMCGVIFIWSLYLILKKNDITLFKKKYAMSFFISLFIFIAALPTLVLFIYLLSYENGFNNFIQYYIIAI